MNDQIQLDNCTCQYCVQKRRIAELEAENAKLKADLNVDVLAVHSGRTTTREWTSVGAWLYPGDKIVLSYRIDAAKGE